MAFLKPSVSPLSLSLIAGPAGGESSPAGVVAAILLRLINIERGILRTNSTTLTDGLSYYFCFDLLITDCAMLLGSKLRVSKVFQVEQFRPASEANE